MTRPRRKAAQVASLVCQQRSRSRHESQRTKPWPVDGGRDDRGQSPHPQVAAIDLVRHSSGCEHRARPPRTPATTAPEIQPLYLNN